MRADPDDRWAAVFGRIAVYSFLVALVSGILLLPFFRASMTPIVYHGSYRKLDGLTMSRAYQSTLNISLDVRGELLIRQVHHWSADLFVAAVCLRLIRVFFRGRFRRPDWLIWVSLLLGGMLAGLSRHVPARRHALRRQPERAHRRDLSCRWWGRRCGR